MNRVLLEAWPFKDKKNVYHCKKRKELENTPLVNSWEMECLLKKHKYIFLDFKAGYFEFNKKRISETLKRKIKLWKYKFIIYNKCVWLWEGVSEWMWMSKCVNEWMNVWVSEWESEHVWVFYFYFNTLILYF